MLTSRGWFFEEERPETPSRRVSLVKKSNTTLSTPATQKRGIKEMSGSYVKLDPGHLQDMLNKKMKRGYNVGLTDKMPPEKSRKD